MRQLPAIIVAVFVGLAALTLLVPWPPAVETARVSGFSDEVIANGMQHSFERRLFWWGTTFIELGLLLALVFTRLGPAATAWCRRLARGWWLPTLLLLAALYYVVLAILDFPLDVGRWAHLRAWGMTERPFGPWFSEYLLALAVRAVLEGVVLVGLYLLLRWLPRWWWLAAAAGSVVLAALFALVLPVVVAPLFNTFTPISETKWAKWERPLHDLVQKANVPLDEILVMNASAQSKHSNAYYTGFAGTRRIVLYDNLLEKHTLPEVESVLAHELGHWLHDHIVIGIALGGLGLLAGLYVLSRILKWAEGRFGLYGPSDPAGLAIVLLAGFLGSWLAMPLSCAVSRHFERQADMMALELAGQPDEFMDAERKLAKDNIGNVAPTPWNVWLFATHPPTVERMQMAVDWKKAISR
ncbi:MAG: M48 family metallopeptidase [Gemmataceae bacterium]|nr:M48 family metallopeptidase [Gemmataceae bacterium]